MCGINGLFGLENIDSPQGLLQSMNDAIAHRGPDAEGLYVNEQLALGHRRLSIIDTAEHSNQPFFNADKSVVLVYNGEIYNYLELKAALPDYPFQTQSDTEVIIAAYQQWGIKCVERFNGMFAFALWDDKIKKLFVVRDRLGIKPLYYSHQDHQFIFSSEIRAILASGLVKKKLSARHLTDYLRYQTVHAPYTLLEEVFVLMPGHYLEISDNEYQSVCFWNLPEQAEQSAGLLDLSNCQSEIRRRMEHSVALRMRADVPFGAFLSGGIDSSIVVGLMSKISSRKINTFSVSFDEAEFSERLFAEQVAKKFGTHHHDIRLTPKDFLTLIPDALDAMDHPSGDGPNTFVVSKMTKKAGITMAMSGLGGDELFAGYEVFKQALTLEEKKWIMSFPKALRKLAGRVLMKWKPSVASDKISALICQDYLDLEHSYPITRQVLLDKDIKKLVSHSNLPPNRVQEIITDLWKFKSKGHDLATLSKVSTAEISTYMQNVLLRDADQMSMAHALEVRVPFLDHHLVELALGVGDRIKYPHSPKQLLVSSFEGMLPPEIVNRPKMGFTLPWKLWMKDELRPMCLQALKSLENRPYFNSGKLTALFHAFEQGQPSVTWSRIWPLIVLEHWLQKHNIE